MDLNSFVTKLLGGGEQEPLVSIDIGSSKIKAMVMDVTGSKPVLQAAGLTPTPANSIKNNVVVNPDHIGAAIRSLIDANEIMLERAVVSIPGPTVFTKKITTSYSPLKDLDNNIRFEAGNFVPHNMNDVYLDYQVLSTNGTSSMDVLLVAVKNDIVQSYLQAVTEAGLEPAIADVDYFAIENMFQLNYPEASDQTVALIDVGARFSAVSILQDGQSLFSGDVSVGGRLYTDALVETLGMEPGEAEEAKVGTSIEGYDDSLIVETLDRTTEHVASELHRNLGFFWNAAGTDRAIEAIYLSGGSALAPGLLESLNSLTGLDCELMEPFKEVDWSENFDQDYLEEIKNSMGVSVGLALRRVGDKKNNL